MEPAEVMANNQIKHKPVKVPITPLAIVLITIPLLSIMIYGHYYQYNSLERARVNLTLYQ